MFFFFISSTRGELTEEARTPIRMKCDDRSPESVSGASWSIQQFYLFIFITKLYSFWAFAFLVEVQSDARLSILSASSLRLTLAGEEMETLFCFDNHTSHRGSADVRELERATEKKEINVICCWTINIMRRVWIINLLFRRRSSLFHPFLVPESLLILVKGERRGIQLEFLPRNNQIY